MKGYEAVASVLADQGVDTVFSLPGDGNLYIDYSLLNDQGVRYVRALREDAAVMMAYGYARVGGGLGLASVTHGPGLTNAVTALTTAARYRTPMLLIVGDTPRSHLHHPQAIDHRAVVEPTGAGFHEVRGAATIAQDVSSAVRRAWAERRPIVLSVSNDDQQADVDDVDVVGVVHSQGHRPSPPISPPIQRLGADPDALDRAVRLLGASRRPVILAGTGAVSSGARDLLLSLAERVGAAVGTSLLAKDLFRSDPWDLGVVGLLSTDVAADVVRQADCLAVFGAGLNEYTSSYGAFSDGKPVIQCDLDATAIGRWTPVTEGLIGDASTVAAAMLERLGPGGAPGSGLRDESVRARLADRPWERFSDRSGDGAVDLRTFLLEIDRCLPEQRTVVCDSGGLMFGAMRFLRVPDPGCWVLTQSFASIGLSTGAAIGAAVARPDRTVVLLLGDGSFMMTMSEFTTAVRERLDIVVFVLDDGSYNAEYHALRRSGLDPSLSLFEWPDFATLARAMGGEGVTVSGRGDIETAAALIANRRGPVLVDVRVDPAVGVAG